MNFVGVLGFRANRKISSFYCIWRSMCTNMEMSDDTLKKMWQNAEFDSSESGDIVNERRSFEEECVYPRSKFFQCARVDAGRVLDVLLEDGPGIDSRAVLNEMNVSINGFLVREVLLGILKLKDHINKTRCAKLGYKFFVWSGARGKYQHTADAYHMIMKIFAECEELKAMWRMVDEMTEKGLSLSARTFNIVICTCGEAGLAKKVVERFIRSQTFNFRPFKNSVNAILHSLLAIQQYGLIEWVHEQMLLEGHLPDVLTYNITMCAKYRLGKMDQFHRLLDEMGRNGYSPDLHTYNILLHVLGKGNKPLAALNLLNHMKEVGMQPTVLHFTTLIDGLSRAGNLEACKYFFDEITKSGHALDVVCYTVMITCYVSAFEIKQAQALFNEMFSKGLLPNVYTYNTMIRGLCMVKKFDEAISMLKEMKSRDCTPNFDVYNTVVRNLQNAGHFSKAHDVIKLMESERQYPHLADKFRHVRRWERT
uniref:Pentatricopeptide repeat-containing protein n=1 Tax=Kalanchoe fedtschenkoi TaxID=63787 RepID=A0A7N0U5X2_KALFE